MQWLHLASNSLSVRKSKNALPSRAFFYALARRLRMSRLLRNYSPANSNGTDTENWVRVLPLYI